MCKYLYKVILFWVTLYSLVTKGIKSNLYCEIAYWPSYDANTTSRVTGGYKALLAIYLLNETAKHAYIDCLEGQCDRQQPQSWDVNQNRETTFEVFPRDKGALSEFFFTSCVVPANNP